jgi:asparagine synthase (glutamine-hydrolysing)
VKVDRAAMAASLETRLPLLDHRLVEFAYRLPVGFKIRAGRTKWPLRQLLYQHLPAGLIDRPKHGFSIPIAGWLRGPLRDWAESLLQPAALEDSGIDSAAVARLWRQHLNGAHDHSARLWAVLMFEAWRDGQ